MVQSILESERIKAEQSLPEMLFYLNKHPERHTPFMDRWFRLCVDHNTMVYPAKPEGAVAGRRLLYGNPARLIDVVESAESFGKPGVFFVKVIE